MYPAGMPAEVKKDLADLKRRLTNRIARDRRQGLRSEAEHLWESGCCGSVGVFYKALRRSSRSSSPVSTDVMDDDGKLATLPGQQAEAFAQHFERVLNCGTACRPRR